MPASEQPNYFLTLHWTAGQYKVSELELEHYHFLIDGDGQVHPGKFTPEQNLHPKSGQYAQHVKAANTANIGVSMCGMKDAAWSEANRGRYGPFALRAIQVEQALSLTAALCVQYNIPVVPARVLAHEEWDSIHGRPQDRWDVCCIPHLDIRPHLNGDGTYDSMNWFRARVADRMAGSNHEIYRPLFGHIVALFDDPLFLELPAATQRLAKQLRNSPPFDQLKR